MTKQKPQKRILDADARKRKRARRLVHFMMRRYAKDVAGFITPDSKLLPTDKWALATGRDAIRSNSIVRNAVRTIGRQSAAAAGYTVMGIVGLAVLPLSISLIPAGLFVFAVIDNVINIKSAIKDIEGQKPALVAHFKTAYIKLKMSEVRGMFTRKKPAPETTATAAQNDNPKPSSRRARVAGFFNEAFKRARAAGNDNAAAPDKTGHKKPGQNGGPQ